MKKAKHVLRRVLKSFNQIKSQQKQSLAELNNAKKLLQQFRAHDFFLNESQKIGGVGSWIWDTKKDRIDWSDNLYRIYDIEPKEFNHTYRDYLSLIPPSQREQTHQAITDAFQHKRSFSFEHKVKTKSGQQRILSCRGKVLCDKNEVKAMIGTTQDITEQRQLEMILVKEKSHAYKSSAAKTKFLADISHEIRTPLSAIVGFAELLSDPKVTEAERKSYITLIKSNADWLTELIENVLDLSKIESGKIQCEKIKVPLGQMLENLRELASTRDSGKLPLEFRFRGNLPTHITTDPTRLRQILINIIRNAQKFTRTGRIVVLTRINLKKQILCFDIADTGIGMTPEQQEKVFGAFIQAERSTTRKFGGTGLGLVLSRRFAEALGGEVLIKRSRPGKGTIFRVTIPLTNEDISILYPIKELPKPEEQQDAEEFPLHDRKILLVDDSHDNRQIVERYLTKAGAQVLTSDNGKEALEILRSAKVDMVLMDLQMPIMDGMQATQEIRKKDRHTPIVALTAHAFLEEKNKCLSLGFNDYITKPINRKVLLEHINHGLEETLH